MPLELPPLLQRFADKTPLPVMAQALLRHCFHTEVLDKLYDQAAEQQYTRKLLFSSMFSLMNEVIFRQQPSLRAAYLQRGREEIGVSLTAVYEKLNGIEPSTLQQLANFSAQSSQDIMDLMEAPVDRWLPGIKTRILDGNVLGGREHRLLETRGSTAAPLPGKSLVVLDPDQQLIIQLHPCEDAYVQERALLPAVLASVQPNELWVADRNFCTTEALLTIGQRGGYSLIREHGSLRFTTLTAEGDSELIEGGRVCEQQVQIADGKGQTLTLRRINVYLSHPTRDGDTVLHLLSTLPQELASAAEVAHYYRKRWKIETAFYRMTMELNCEIETLAYPGAALFGFTVAAVAFNALSVLMGAMRAVHGQEVMDNEFSTYYMANEMANMQASLNEVVDEQDWTVFLTVSSAMMAAWLLATATRVNLKKYPKAQSRKKKQPERQPKVQRHNDKGKPHVSTARLLAQRKAGKKQP